MKKLESLFTKLFESYAKTEQILSFRKVACLFWNVPRVVHKNLGKKLSKTWLKIPKIAKNVKLLYNRVLSKLIYIIISNGIKENCGRKKILSHLKIFREINWQYVMIGKKGKVDFT